MTSRPRLLAQSAVLLLFVLLASRGWMRHKSRHFLCLDDVLFSFHSNHIQFTACLTTQPPLSHSVLDPGINSASNLRHHDVQAAEAAGHDKLDGFGLILGGAR